ncbi:MAG TPA: hypothetical protein VK973_02595, partial [Arenicellales bacterium]|nr:hypothetical protein [Arenicellales bacterium]
MNEQNQNDDQAPVPERRRRRYPWIIAGLLLAIVALVAAAPSLLSSPAVRGPLLGWYNDAIPGEIEVSNVSLSWFGGQTIQGVVVRDAQGQTALRLDELSTDLSLFGALRRQFTVGRTVVRGLDIDLRFTEDGGNNLAAAFGAGTEAGESAGGPLVPVTGNMSLVDSRVTITAPGIEPIVLEELSGEAAMTGQDAPVHVAFKGRSRQGELAGGFELDGQVEDLFRQGELDMESATASVDARVEDLPVDAVDRLMGFQGLLSAALGDRTSIDMRAGGDTTRQTVAVQATSPNASLELAGAVADGWFRLESPASAALKVSPALVDALGGAAGTEPAARLADPVPLKLEMERLDIPVASFSTAAIALESTLAAEDAVRLTDIPQIGEMTINGLGLRVSSAGLAERVTVSLSGTPVTGGREGELAFDADIDRLFDEGGNLQVDRATVTAQSSIRGIPVMLVDAALQQEGLLVDALGDVLALDANIDTDSDGRLSVAASVESPRLQTGPVRLLVNEDVTLQEPARLQAAVSPRLWQRLLGAGAAYRLDQPVDLTLELGSLRLPLPANEAPAFQPAATQLSAVLSAPAMHLVDAASGQPTRIDELRVELDAELGLENIVIAGAATVLQPGGELDSLNASPLRVRLDGESGLNEDASLKQVASSVTLQSNGLEAALDTLIDDGLSRLSLRQPATFSLLLTPELVAAWQASSAPAMTLAESARVEGTLERLDLLLSDAGLAGVQAAGRTVLGDSGSITLRSPGGLATRLDEAAASFEFAGADGGTGRMELHAGVRSSDGETGNLAFNASASRMLNADGGLATDAMTLKLDGALEQLPVALVDQLLNMEGTASATLGATADLRLEAELERMQGPVSLTLRAPTARADVRARVEEAGLTLAEPLTAEVEPTPEFGSQVLAKVHPIFETTQRAERPIRFEIPPQGVVIPLQDFDFARVAVPVMTLDFGRVVLKSGWLLRGVIGLGQRFGKLDSVQRDEWVAWFTPGVMAIKDGQIHYTRRLDLLLAEKLHLATWGSADVSRDRSNLVLAFMPGTMERVFSITVAGDDALHVPITGPLSGPSIDFQKAGADLARLRAQEEVSGENPLAGALLGAVTGKPAAGGGSIP